MVTFVFTIDDLARTRFAISPMWELVSGLRALRDPARAALHMPWVERALPIAHRLELDSILALTPAEGYFPDFITPPPSTPLASFEEELELVRATPASQIRAGIEIFAACNRHSPILDRFRDHPRREVGRMCAALKQFWEQALESDWPRIRSVLEADLRHRSRRLTEGGPSKLFDDLHPKVSWHGERLEVDQSYTEVVELAGKGLLLVPSAMQSTGPGSITEAPWQPTLIYPSRGLGLLWEPGAQAGPEALAGLLGRTRADLLAALSAPRSTTELADSLGLTPGGVSQHLAVLRRSGMVEGDRHGRSVLYLRTPAADRLVEAGD
jgi:DNA-binding transcriptional ArsR family regulator